jgi:hypothetical protein
MFLSTLEKEKEYPAFGGGYSHAVLEGKDARSLIKNKTGIL